ncbi:MAG: hypothetical protein KBC02_03180 [Candidatus Pacebacteria bacterium]|nr:hypothetical protein [Candidatus Paceibacterota bacterium]
MNQKRIGLTALWASLVYLIGIALQMFVLTRTDTRYTITTTLLVSGAFLYIGYTVTKCWLVANMFQFNARPDRESELPEGSWNVTKAFPDPFSKPAGHFYLVLNTLTPNKQRDVHATLVVQRQMLDQESTKRITDGERPMTVVIKNGIIGFKWPGTLDPVA